MLMIRNNTTIAMMKNFNTHFSNREGLGFSLKLEYILLINGHNIDIIKVKTDPKIADKFAILSDKIHAIVVIIIKKIVFNNRLVKTILNCKMEITFPDVIATPMGK